MNARPRRPEPIDSLKRLAGAPLAAVLLDAIQPIAPVVAQGLWVAQPLARLWNGADALGDLAELLEAPGGIDTLRQRLADDKED